MAELQTLQAEYQDWRDQVPEALAGSRTAERLDAVCDLDLDAFDVDLPRRFGRHCNAPEPRTARRPTTSGTSTPAATPQPVVRAERPPENGPSGAQGGGVMW